MYVYRCTTPRIPRALTYSRPQVGGAEGEGFPSALAGEGSESGSTGSRTPRAPQGIPHPNSPHPEFESRIANSGPRGMLFRMSEVPLYPSHPARANRLTTTPSC